MRSEEEKGLSKPTVLTFLQSRNLNHFRSLILQGYDPDDICPSSICEQQISQACIELTLVYQTVNFVYQQATLFRRAFNNEFFYVLLYALSPDRHLVNFILCWDL